MFGTLTRRLSAVAALLMLVGAARAEASDAILGVWLTAERDGKIEIFKQSANVYAARVFAAPPEEADKTDRLNPDPARRGQKLLGAIVLSGFVPDGQGQWTKGKAYDPDSGKLYDAKMWLDGRDTLKIRGFLGFEVLGRTETFTRVSAAEARRSPPGEQRLVHLDR